MASVYAVAPQTTGLRRLSSVNAHNNKLEEFLGRRRRTTESSSNTTTSELHIWVSNTVFSDIVLGASPGADTTAVIFSVGASLELSDSTIVGTTKDAQKVEELPQLIYVESAPFLMRDNCFVGNDDGIAPVVAQSAMINAVSNFNQRTTSRLSQSNCEFIAHNTTGTGGAFACQPSDASVCTAKSTNYRFACISYLDEIYFSEWDVSDSTIPRTYILCTDSVFRIGSRHDSDGTPIGGSYPIILGRSNIRVICGLDGKIDNGCNVVNGVVQVAHFDEYQTGGTPIENAEVHGISFSGASAINALVSGTGDVVFNNCVFHENSNVAAVYVQRVVPRSRGRRKLHSVARDLAESTTTRILTTSAEDDTATLRAHFDSCLFVVSMIWLKKAF